MDLKAFNKLYSEAVDAIAERRVIDAISLVDAIQKDNHEEDNNKLSLLRLHYEEIVGGFTAGHSSNQEKAALNQLFCDLIDSLQLVRLGWLVSHKLTTYGRLAAQLTNLHENDLADQLHRTTLCKLGDPAYEQALDAAFGIAWCCEIRSSSTLDQSLKQCDNFVRRVLVGALLLGVLDCFSIEKITLLLQLGIVAKHELKNTALIDDESQRETIETEAKDLLSRVLVALTLISQRHAVFFTHYTELTKAIKDFFYDQLVRPDIPLVLHAMVCQSMTDRAGERVDDIMSIIKGVVEKLQPRLGTNNGDASGEEKQEHGFEMHVTKIELKANKKLFKEMANYAEDVDNMRQNDMDVNHNNFIHMKQFDFFGHPAHWFYPFDLNEPTIQKGLHHPNGKLDLMTLSIMDHSRFCDSDRYSYACMMAYLRRDNRKSISDNIIEQINEMQDDDDLPFDLEESAEYRLNPYVNFCQTCYRFFHRQAMAEDYAYTFAPTDDMLLPMSSFFEGVFTDFREVENSVEAFLHMGDGEHAVILLNHMMERYGATARSLELKGRALMQLRQWRSAISCFQQELIIEENPESQMAMARCYEALHDWNHALPLLLAEEQRQEGKDANIIEEIARCHIQLEQWDEAIQRFFQLELIGEHLNVSRRGIGWCSLKQGKYARAENYYRKQIESSSRISWEDYINLGHALWLQGRISDALNSYQKFSTAFNRCKKAQRHNFCHWTEAFREDARTLLSPHFSEVELALMQDAISMK